MTALFFVSGIVGALVASRFPANPIGWLFVGLILSLGLTGAAEGYVALAVDEDRLGGLTPWAALYAAKVFVAFLAALFYALLLFPDGRLPDEAVAVRVLGRHGGPRPVHGVRRAACREARRRIPRLTNPAGVDSPVVSWLAAAGFLLFTAALVGSAVSLGVRFRRARGIERQQLTLVLAAGAFATATFLVSWPLRAVSDGLADGITLFGILAIPVAIGVAMLRYRLYEIDRVISRTLVYGALTVILGAAYVGLVLAGQAVFSSFAGGSNLAIAVSTLVVAALFLPVRSRVQRLVDRRFYRRRYDAQRTLEAFGARLREQVELDALAADLRERRRRDDAARARLALAAPGGRVVSALHDVARLGPRGARVALHLARSRLRRARHRRSARRGTRRRRSAPPAPTSRSTPSRWSALVIATRRPENAIGWLFLATGVVLGLDGCRARAMRTTRSMPTRGGCPPAIWVAWTVAWLDPRVLRRRRPAAPALPGRSAAVAALATRSRGARRDRRRS